MAKLIDTSALLTPEDIRSLDPNTRDWVYNGLDVCVTLEIRDALLPQLDDTTSATYDFSRSLQAPILEMMMRGVLVDQGRRAEVLRQYRDQINRLDEQLTALAFEGVGYTAAVNDKKTKWWRSPARLSNLLYDVMGLPPVKARNAQGIFAPTVNRDALEKLQADYFIVEPIIAHLLLLRDIDKKRSFLETGIDPDGRIRTNFGIAGTNTGRLASAMSDFGTGGNLQNVDRELRSVFISDPGFKFANLDLEQGDARNVGAICWNLFVEEHGEAYAGSYLDACESGDLHSYNTKLIWPGEDPHALFYRQDTYRQMAKKGGHGTNYFGTPITMAKHLKVPRALIEDFQRRYFGVYPVIGCYDPKHTDPSGTLPNWHNAVRAQIRSVHHITTMLGRRRFFFGRDTDDSTLREAIAYEPQSLTADEIDRGLLSLWRSNRVHVLIQVHDSILIQYPEEQEAEIIPWALEALKTHIKLKKGRDFVVPTEAKIGWNWGEASDTNPDGLVKWKGADARKRTDAPWQRKTFSIFDL